jgi:hypothetical protein
VVTRPTGVVTARLAPDLRIAAVVVERHTTACAGLEATVGR